MTPDSSASAAPSNAVVPSAPAATPAPATKAADARNRRLLLLIGGGSFLLILLAFLVAMFTKPKELQGRVAQVQSRALPPGSSAAMQRPVENDVPGFVSARGARGEAPTPPPVSSVSEVAPASVAPPQPPAIFPASLSVGPSRRSTATSATARTSAAEQRPARGLVPAFQLVPCKLVSTLESGVEASGSNSGGGGAGTTDTGANANAISSPIVGLVTEDVRTWDTHEVIIPKGTQVNVVGTFPRERDRVFVDKDFTFVLEGRGAARTPLELVLPGIAMDRVFDGQVDSYGVTDMSAGIRGDLLESPAGNFATAKIFALKFLSGASGALSATSSSSFGQAFSNGATSGAAGGLPGYVINPAVGGSQAVLDREAERIAARIAREGYFLRVPANARFYVQVQRGFSLRDALPPGRAQALREQREDDRLRRRDERRARERAAEGGGGFAGASGATDPALAALLTNSNQNLNNVLRRLPDVTTGVANPALRTPRQPTAGETINSAPLPAQ